MPISEAPLTDKQDEFCRRYVADVLDANATKAAIGAGYAASGAHVAASKLLKLPKVQRRIRELRENLIVVAQGPSVPAVVTPAPLADAQPRRVIEAEVDGVPVAVTEESRVEAVKTVESAAADVIRELQWLSYSDVTELFDVATGDLVTVTDLKALPVHVRRCIKAIKVKTVTMTTGMIPTTTTTYELTLWPKDVALGMLAKFHGLLKDVVETRNLTLEDALDEAERMARGPS